MTFHTGDNLVYNRRTRTLPGRQWHTVVALVTRTGHPRVTALTDEAGDVSHEYLYAVFGKIIGENGDIIENQFTYTSREKDEETGNYYYRARYYNSTIGRFISEDSLGKASGDLNFFRYATNDPISNNDPTGMAIWVCSRPTRIGSIEGFLLKVFSLGTALHSYLWDDRTGTPCSLGDKNQKEKGPGSQDKCVKVPGSDGKETQIMKCCDAARTYTSGWFPCIWDCQVMTETCTGIFATKTKSPGGRGPLDPCHDQCNK